jgi:polyferredoxin
MRYRLRTLLIVLALGPPVLAGAWWGIVCPVLYVQELTLKSELPREEWPENPRTLFGR